MRPDRMASGFPMQENNPYQSPREESVYFTDDITTLPVSYVWKVVCRMGVGGVLFFFPIVLFRKLLGLRFPANHATRRLTEFSSVRVDGVPVEFREYFAPMEAACRAAGMEPAFH